MEGAGEGLQQSWRSQSAHGRQLQREVGGALVLVCGRGRHMFEEEKLLGLGLVAKATPAGRTNST